jgi:hypothetical protein
MVTQQSLERKLLLALLGRDREAQDIAEMLSLLRQVNWESFLSTTSVDLYPFVLSRLEPYLSFLPAQAECERFFKVRRLTAIHNLRLRHELGRTLKALRQSGIPALALKGAVMAYTVYADPSLRPMSDLDLLVPPDKKESASRVLRTLGYDYPESALATHRDLIWRLGPNQEYVPPLRLRGSKVLLEVHSQLDCSDPVFPMPVDEFWSRSIVVDLKGLEVRTLCPEDFLFHVCLHQSRSHRFEKGLLPLVDVKLLLDSRSDWNWAQIVERSLRSGCATWMYLTLEVARDLVGARVPDSFFQALRQPRDPPRLRSLVEEQIWSAQSGQPPVPLFLPRLLAEVSWRSRTRMILTRLRLVGDTELDSDSTESSFLRRARASLRQLLATLRSRIPHYFHTLKSGRLNLRTIRKTAFLMRASDNLFQLIERETVGAEGNSLVDTTSRVPLERSANHSRPM